MAKPAWPSTACLVPRQGVQRSYCQKLPSVAKKPPTGVSTQKRCKTMVCNARACALFQVARGEGKSKAKNKTQGSIRRPLPHPTPIPNYLKPPECGGQVLGLFNNNSLPHYRPLIQWCLFKQYSHLLLNNKGIMLPPTAPASPQPCGLGELAMNAMVGKPFQVHIHAPAWHSLPAQAPQRGRGTQPSHAQLGKLTGGHTVPCFHTKNLINITFQKFIARNNTSKMHFFSLVYSYNSNRTIQSIFTVSLVNQQDDSVFL